MELGLLGATLVLSLIAATAVSILYVSDIKTKVAEHGIKLDNVEKNADRIEKSLTERMIGEVQRIEAAFERRIAEAIERFRSRK